MTVCTENMKLNGKTLEIDVSDIVLSERLALAPEDAGKSVSLELLKRRLPSNVCQPYYQIVEEYVNNAMKELKDMRYAAAHPNEVKTKKALGSNSFLYTILMYGAVCVSVLPVSGLALAEKGLLAIFVVPVTAVLSYLVARCWAFIDTIPPAEENWRINNAHLIMTFLRKLIIIAPTLLGVSVLFTNEMGGGGLIGRIMCAIAGVIHLYLNRATYRNTSVKDVITRYDNATRSINDWLLRMMGLKK